jgi:hypothetical protein
LPIVGIADWRLPIEKPQNRCGVTLDRKDEIGQSKIDNRKSAISSIGSQIAAIVNRPSAIGNDKLPT